MSINRNKIVAIIPARSGSKGVPDKNIMNIQGRPLISYSIMAALKSKLIDRVIVSTDSDHYAEISKRYGAEVPFLRPKEISQDGSTDIEFFNHLIGWFCNNEEYIPPISNQLFDFIPLRELARAYFLIGAAVENKSEYFIGSGRPRTLGEYFSRFSAIIKGLNMTSPKQEYCASEFNTDHITDDLGFQLAYNFDDIAKKLERS